MLATQSKNNKKKNEAVAFVLNTTSNSYYDLAKTCLERIITRKLMINCTDEFCLILSGTEDNNDFEYEHIVCPFALESCSWDMLRYLKTEVEPSKSVADWFQALILAADKLRLSENESKRIVFFNDFSHCPESDQMQRVMEELSSEQISLTIVGPDHIQEVIYDAGDEPSSKRIKTSNEESKNVEIIKQMWEQLGDKMELTNYEEALRLVTVYKAEPKKGRPWNVDLTIADITIPVAAFIHVDASTKKPTARTRLMATSVNVGQLTTPEMMEVEATPVVSFKELTTVAADGEKVPIAREDVGKARAYGCTLVPFSEEDKAAMGYKSGIKCLAVLGFTSLAKLKRHYIVGKGCHIITPQKNSNGLALSALVQALHSMGRAAVARKVYYNNGSLSLVLLSPICEEWEEDGQKIYKQCLAMNELVWKEGLKLIPFPALNCVVTDEQTKAIDEMIDSMDLMTASKGIDGEATEVFQISSLVEEKNEYYVYCLVERALFPDKPLPNKLPASFSNMSWPKSVQEKLDAVKKLFPIEMKPDKQLERKEKYRALALKKREAEVREEFDEEADLIPAALKIENFPKPEIESGDSEPVHDVKVVFREQMLPPPRALIGILQIHLEDNNTDVDMALICIEKCINHLREFAIKINPQEFNDWLSEICRIAPDSGGLYKFFSKIEKIPTNDDSRIIVPESVDTPQIAPECRSTLEIEKSQALHEFF